MYIQWGYYKELCTYYALPPIKIINPAKNIGVSNLKDKIGKDTLSKFGNNVKYFLDDMSSNYSIIIYKVECHEDHMRHIFRDIFLGPNSTFSNRIPISIHHS